MQVSKVHQLHAQLIHALRMLTARPHTDQILQFITESSATLMEAEGASLLLVDADSEEFVFRHVSGDKSDAVKELRMSLDQGIAGWVYRNRARAVSWEVQSDDRFHTAVDAKTGFHTHSLVAVPLFIDGRVLGVLEVVNLTPRSEDDLDLLQGFANQCAAILETSREWAKMAMENRYLREQLEAERAFVAASPAMEAVADVAQRAARSDATVLLLGESGTGKEIMARYIHRCSHRNAGPFVAVNSAGLSEELLESELFGHEKGAFTGAHALKHGKLEVAQGGTFFLDEVGELKLAIQAKLLRVLQERLFERVGGTERIRVDARLICATNRDLKAEIGAGRFREDLFYRINVVPIELPPLRERREEIVPLAEHFIQCHCRRHGLEPKALLPATAHCLSEYAWPGNVRELENVMERAVVLGRDDAISPQELPMEVAGDRGRPGSPSRTAVALGYHEAVREKRREILLDALHETEGNQKDAAQQLGITPAYFSKLMKDLELSNPYKARAREGGDPRR